MIHNNSILISIPGTMQKFRVCVPVPKDTRIHYAHLIGFELAFVTPVELCPEDCVWVDVRGGRVEIVERAGIAIWRSGWVN